MECKICGKTPEWSALDGNYCSLTCMADEATASYEASVMNAFNIVHDHIRTSMDGVQSQIRDDIVRGNKSPKSNQN
jgi:phosphate uptake regulator